jgi:hypothetical protein
MSGISNIYGYLNRVQSSRRLERDAGRNVEVMWLTVSAPVRFVRVEGLRRTRLPVDQR